MIFRTLPPFGADQRGVAEVVRGIMDGKTNNTGTLTLATGNATTTTLYDERISPDSKIIFVPMSAAAFSDTAPYGAFQDNTDQTAAAIDVAYAVAFGTTDEENGVYISNTSRINVRNAGLYDCQFSIQVKNTTNDSQSIDIWFRKNGTDITASTSRVSVPKTGDGGAMLPQITIMESVAANDYIQIMWAPENAAVTLDFVTNITSPFTAPSTPSVIVTALRVA